MMAWQTVPETELQVPGQHYRAVMSVRAPYPESVGPLEAAFKVQSALNHDITITAFGHLPPLWDEHAGKYGPFTFWYEYDVNPSGASLLKPGDPGLDGAPVSQAGLDPWVIVTLIGAVIAGLTALALVSRRLEKLVSDTTTSVADASPSLVGIGIVVVLGLFLMFTKGGR